MGGWTKGPWEALPQSGAGPMIVHRYDTGNQMQPTGLRLIAHMLERGNSINQDRANAHLIAAAPDLAEALERLDRLSLVIESAVRRADSSNRDAVVDAIKNARAALSKARGE